MVDAGWDKERILITPLTLYMEYINLKYDAFLKEKLKDLDITTGDLTYLINIFYHEKLSQRQLADILYVSEANVAKILKRLEKKGYIERVKDENNKSRKLINLTEKGNLTTYSLIKITYEWENKITDNFTDKEVSNLKEVLYELTQNSADF